MTEISENDNDQKMTFTEKEKFLLRISSITDLSVPPMILDQLLPVLSQQELLPEDFSRSQLLHDPSIVAYFLKQFYEEEANRELLFAGMDDIFNQMNKEEIYVLLSEMSPMENFDPVDVAEWKHAYSTHLLMHAIVSENEFSQLMYLIPLMLVHDIGKLVLHHVVPETCAEIVAAAEKRKIARCTAEDEVLNLNHADAGARLLKEWHFPERFVKPIQYHHSAEIPDEYVLETALVQFVNWVDCYVRGIPATPLNQETMTAAGIEEIDTEYWVARHRKTVAEIDRFFEPKGIMDNNTTEE